MRRFFTAIIFLLAAVAFPQDREWLRTWEEAQRHRPRTIPSISRIAPAGEPGTPLIVHGRVVKSDGVTPAPDVVVFAYQTDHSGVYNERGQREWRLRGWARSDANGRFEFRTIRPGSYPRSRAAAHIHVTIDGPGLPRRWTRDINFADDPFAEKGSPEVLPVTVRDGVQHVNYTIRISETGKF